MSDPFVQRCARKLWPRVVRLMDHVTQAQWPQVAALLEPFVSEPTAANYLGTHRALGEWLRRDAMTRTVTSRWQAELDAVREALAHDARFAPLAHGRATDARAGDRLSVLALMTALRELAEAKGEAASQLVKERLRVAVKNKPRATNG